MSRRLDEEQAGLSAVSEVQRIGCQLSAVLCDGRTQLVQPRELRQRAALARLRQQARDASQRLLRPRRRQLLLPRRRPQPQAGGSGRARHHGRRRVRVDSGRRQPVQLELPVHHPAPVLQQRRLHAAAVLLHRPRQLRRHAAQRGRHQRVHCGAPREPHRGGGAPPRLAEYQPEMRRRVPERAL